MKLGDKELNNLARNIRKACSKRESCSFPNKCKYKIRYCDKIRLEVSPVYMLIKELADELRGAGF